MENKSNNIPSPQEFEELSNQVNGPDFLRDDDWWGVSVDNEVLDVTKEYPIRYSLSINSIPFAPLGGIHGMTGQPGHGKTMTLSMVAAAVLGDKSHGMEWLLSEEFPKPKVLYIDTEMEKGNTMLVNKRICAMLGWDWHKPHEELVILCLREVTKATDRWRKVLKAIYQYKPTVVILDGIIDVVADFNDNTDCQELISKCMACASYYNISFWALLHENPGSEKMVGHAGSFLERKASDVMVTRKTKDQSTGEVSFELTNKKVRGQDWDGYVFKVDNTRYSFGIPILLSEDPYSKKVKDIAQILKNNIHAFKDGGVDSKKQIMERLGGKPKNKKEKFEIAIEKGFVTELTDVIQNGGSHPYRIEIDRIESFLTEGDDSPF